MVNEYYQKHKERLRKEARERYQNFNEVGKEKRHQYNQELIRSYLSIEEIII